MSLRFVHAADLHLGSRLWLERLPASRELRARLAGATQRALAALVELCLSERADYLLCVGDVFDGWCRGYEVALRLAAELERLAAGGCRTLLVLGNHDVRQRALSTLLLPAGAQVLGRSEPETWRDERLGLAVHGLSTPPQQGDVSELFPPPVAGLFNVGLLHTSAEGASGHVDYAPCSRVALRHKGYDYWALGHVHRHAVIWHRPLIVYPGNLQGRSSREAGPRGAMLVEVEGRQVVRCEHRALAPVRFERLELDGRAVRSLSELVVSVASALAGLEPDPGVQLVLDVHAEGEAACAYALEAGARGRGAQFEELRRALEPRGLFLHRVSFAAAELGLALAA